MSNYLKSLKNKWSVVTVVTFVSLILFLFLTAGVLSGCAATVFGKGVAHKATVLSPEQFVKTYPKGRHVLIRKSVVANLELNSGITADQLLDNETIMSTIPDKNGKLSQYVMLVFHFKKHYMFAVTFYVDSDQNLVRARLIASQLKLATLSDGTKKLIAIPVMVGNFTPAHKDWAKVVKDFNALKTELFTQRKGDVEFPDIPAILTWAAEKANKALSKPASLYHTKWEV